MITHNQCSPTEPVSAVRNHWFLSVPRTQLNSVMSPPAPAVPIFPCRDPAPHLPASQAGQDLPQGCAAPEPLL